MRINSPKQAAASRANGAKSKGPKSAAGKNKAANNSLRDGAFSRQVVIEQLGESQTEFESFKKAVWKVLQPSNIVEEILVSDFIENWWRRERIRRAEASELRSRLALLELRNDLRRADGVEILRSRFLVLYETYLATHLPDVLSELENTRQELVSNALGVDFLIGILEYLKETAEKDGVLSPKDEILFKACCGFGSKESQSVAKLNFINKRESSKWPNSSSTTSETAGEETVSAQNDEILRFARALQRNSRIRRETTNTSDSQASTTTDSEEAKTGSGRKVEEESAEKLKADYSAILSGAISTGICSLRVRKQKLAFIAAGEKNSSDSMAIIDQTSSDSFSKAEIAVDRRIYRALAMLAAIKTSLSSPLLPDPNGSK